MPKRMPSLTYEMRKHVKCFGGKAAYLKWCDFNMFDCHFDKTSKQIAEEGARYAEEREQAKERAKLQAELHRNPKKLLSDICLGRIASKDVGRRPWQQLGLVVEHHVKPEAREDFLLLAQRVHSVAEFLLEEVEIDGFETSYALALGKLNGRRHQWRRGIESWKPASHNPWRQYLSLVHHLLADYPIPPFMERVWFNSSEQHCDWYVHIGAGKNIRTAKTPVPLTKLMAHHMMLAPDHYSIEHAIRWGQVHALGGDRLLADAVIASRLGRKFSNDEFWLSVVRFLVANPMFDRHQVGPLVDYLRHQKYSRREEVDEAGRARVLRPLQPHLSMRGRTPQNLMQQIERWHRELGRARGITEGPFPASGISPLELKAGRSGENTWRINELLSASELRKEGEAMHHCVASYDRSCVAGRCSVWSMQLEKKLGTERRQTIEVSKQGEIVQARGKYNRLPTRSEFNILKIWAERAGLRIASYVRAEA